MVRKAAKKTWRAYFGEKFNLWDLVLLILLLGSSYYILVTEGIDFLMESTASWVYGSLILGLIINQIVKKARK
ncbi:MAG: hypothetical protein ACOCRO_09780 [Halanaerobiales bacterium]